MTAVDIQISPANASWPELREAVEQAEADGFEVFWVFDHLAGQPLQGTTMLDTFALLGALTEITDRIELGTMVANVWNRQIGSLLVAAASVSIMSERPFHLGIGAGANPSTRWADEQRAVDAHVEPALAGRHERVEQAIDLARRMWDPDRGERFATFPLPDRAPTLIVGANSVRLSRIAGRLADGVNIQWAHPRRDEFLAAVDDEVGDRPFLRTVYADYDPALLDPEHPTRVSMRNRGVDRLVLSRLSLDDRRLATRIG